MIKYFILNCRVSGHLWHDGVDVGHISSGNGVIGVVVTVIVAMLLLVTVTGLFKE